MTVSVPGSCWRLAAAAAASLSLGTARAQAQSSCIASTSPVAHQQPARTWSGLLQRSVSLDARGIPLRDALDRLAVEAGVRLSYNAELLPLQRVVCVTWQRAALGDVLNWLLSDVGVQPVAFGDQIVLAPVARSRTAASAPPLASSVGVLERVLVTESASNADARSTTIALDVVDGSRIARDAQTGVSQMLDGTVPGMWVWSQSPSTLLARYGSIRGASSFGVSYPKMYIDGIEVANPLLVTQLNPEQIARIEVLRGPQGAALYGADAISGVVSVITRQGATEPHASRLQVHSSLGGSESEFSASGGPVLVQEHGIDVQAGSGLRSGTMSAAWSTVGDFLPGGASHEVRTSGAARVIGERSTITGTARYYSKDAGIPTNPLLSGPLAKSLGSEVNLLSPTTSSEPQQIRQYTVGGTATFSGSGRWTHAVTVGLDGYRLSNVPNELTPVPSAADSALHAARGAANRATLRASSVAQLLGATGGRASATLTLSAEHSLLRERTAATAFVAPGPLVIDETAWSTTSGVVVQTSASLDKALFVTSGLRLERDGSGDAHHTATLPMFGAAYVRDVGPLSAKLRAAYGRGLRPVRFATEAMRRFGMRAMSMTPLAPEEQSGVELGTDLYFRRALALHVTRFDQRAFGLIQPVAFLQHDALHNAGVVYALQNVGEIANSGWELQGTVGHRALRLTGSLSLVDSRVLRVADGYTGDLRAGDRMLGVPARTSGVTASSAFAGWSGSVSAVRAADWVNYDRLAVASAYTDTTVWRGAFTGASLRSFWKTYPGITRIRANLSRNLTRGLTLTLTGDNLLDVQQGEPDNASVLPGRTITAGVRARF